MKGIQKTALGIACALGLALLVPSGARASLDTKLPGSCTEPTAGYTLTVTITLASDNTPQASPDTNKGGTCVMGGDSIAFDTSALPAGATWYATFPAPTAGSLFQNSCTFGDGTNQSSSCTVITSPPAATYSYGITVTVNNVAKTLDPKVIIQNSGMGKHHHHHATAPAPAPQP